MVLGILKAELNDELDNCKTTECHKITHDYCCKCFGEHNIHDDVSNANCDIVHESLLEKPEIKNFFVLVDLPSPECTITDLKSYVDLDKMLRHEATDTGLAYAPVSQAHGHLK